MNSRALLAAAIIVASALLVACGGTGARRPTPSPSAAATATPVAEATNATGAATATAAAAPMYEFSAVAFVSPLVGWAAGETGIYATTDGGKRWQRQYTLATTTLDAVDASTVFAVAASNGLIMTTDGGKHWVQQSEDGENNPSSIDFLSATLGFVTGATERGDPVEHLLRTEDGGHLYTDVISPAQAVCFGTPGVGWIADAKGNVRATTDGGGTWTASFTDPLADEGDRDWKPTLACHGSSVVWLLVADGVGLGHEAYAMFRTLDAGAHWAPVLQGQMGPGLGVPAGDAYPGPIAVLDAETAVVGGTCGPCDDAPHHASGTSSVRVTRDGGASWRAFGISGAGSTLSSISFADAAHGWAATGNGVFGTADGGQTWQRQLPGRLDAPAP